VTWPYDSKPARTAWYQFKIAELFLFVTLACVALVVWPHFGFLPALLLALTGAVSSLFEFRPPPESEPHVNPEQARLVTWWLRIYAALVLSSFMFAMTIVFGVVLLLNGLIGFDDIGFWSRVLTLGGFVVGFAVSWIGFKVRSVTAAIYMLVGGFGV
jgi:hypothetical protein